MSYDSATPRTPSAGYTSPSIQSTATPLPPPPKQAAFIEQSATSPRGPPVPPPPQQYRRYQSTSSPAPAPYPPRSSSQLHQRAQHPQQESQPPRSESRPQSSQSHGTREHHGLRLPPEGWLPPGLNEKSKSDLQRLLQRTDLLEALLYNPSTTHPSITASTSTLQAHIDRSLALANQLNDLYTQLIRKRQDVQTHFLAVRGLESRWKKKQSELEAKLEPWGPRELHQRLGTSIAEQEALCLGVEESFIEDDGGGVRSEREVAEWVKRVREGRKTVHLRRERKTRWDEGRVGGWR